MSITLGSTNIKYGETTTITVNSLNNISIQPSNLVINIENTLTGIIATVEPEISTIFYIVGYDDLNNQLNYNETVYVNVTPQNRNYTVDYNKPLVLTVNGSSSYKWYPDLYLNTTVGDIVITQPLEDIVYTVYGTDPFNLLSRSTINIYVNTNLVFTPSNPTVYDGNLLNLSVNYVGNNSNLTYTWKSNMFAQLPDNCVNLKYGQSIKLNPYKTVEYKVNAYNNFLISSANILVNVIEKPSYVIDIDILPLSIYKLVINRNTKGLTDALIKNNVLSQKIIKFYYTTIQTAYRMQNTNKNGISIKIPWYTYYQKINESNEMILNFAQQWKFFQFINGNITSNFAFLLKTVNKIYLEYPQKIYITPL